MSRTPTRRRQRSTPARAAGVDLDRISADLTDEDVQAFCASYRQLLDRIQSKLPSLGRDTLAIEAPQALTAATHPARWDPEAAE